MLDCGCGMGEWTVQLAEEGVDVVGIDIAAKRIELLAFSVSATRWLSARQRSSRRAFQESSFDVLFNWGGAEHFEAGLQLAFSEAWRVLKPGGYFLASTPAHNFRHMLRGFRTPPPENCAANRRFYQSTVFSPKPRCTPNSRWPGFEIERILFLDAHEGARRWLAELSAGGSHAQWPGQRSRGACCRCWVLGHMIFGIGTEAGSCDVPLTHDGARPPPGNGLRTSAFAPWPRATPARAPPLRRGR